MKDILLPGATVVLQYVNDLLLVSQTYEDSLKDTICLCAALAEKDHRASLSKLQLSQQKAKYLEFILKVGHGLVDPEQVQAALCPNWVTRYQHPFLSDH